MKNYQNKRNGLLQLGLIVSLGSTLVGFEYANVDVRTNQVRTNKITDLEIETVYDEIEIKKPEVPKPPVQNQSPVVNPNPTPTPTPGPIIPSPDPVPDPGYDPSFDSDITPLPGGFGEQEIDDRDRTIGSDLLRDFPTYKEFLKIKDVEKRRKKTNEALVKKVNSKAVYPEAARGVGAQGTVRVAFVVDKEGKITNVQVVKSLDPLLDKAAIEAVSKLPQMIPGKNLDKPVNCQFVLPITFVLN